MHTSQWNRERFKDVLEEIQTRTKLSQGDLAQLAGRHRTQINRWIRSENQPSYDAVQRLASAIAAAYPEVALLARELMEAAGYSGSVADPGEKADTVEAKVTVPTPGDQPDVSAMETEIARILAGMTPDERARYEHVIQEEEEDYQRRRIRHRLLFAKLMRGEPIDESDVNP